MKLRVLFCISLTLLLTMSFPLCTVNAQAQTKLTDASRLTDANVRAVMNAVNVAAKKANVAGMVAHIASDAVLELTIETNEGAKTRTLTRDEYAAYTKRGFSRIVTFKFERTIKSLTTSKDGKKAMVVSESFESLTFEEGTLNGMSDEISIFELRGGKPMLVSYKATMRIV